MICSCISPESYGDFSQRVHESGIKRKLPLNGGVEITERCNFKCIHCYIRDDTSSFAAKQELSVDEWAEILDQLAQAGCLWLQITGGEPLIRDDFEEIYIAAKQRGLIPILFTNGSLITQERADFLRKYPPFLASISLYGASRETYDRITGRASNFDQVLKGIKLLLNNGIEVALKSPIINANKCDILAMQELSKELGVKFSFDPIINQGVNKRLDGELLRLSPDEVVALDSADSIRKREWQNLYQKYATPSTDNPSLFYCNAGRGNFHIDAYGNLSACILSRNPSFNLKSGRFQDGWQNLISKTPEQQRTRNEPCRSCEIRILCNQCPGFAMLELNDREGRVGYLCEIAHKRKAHVIDAV